MQGRKHYEDEKELRFSLSAHVPEHNFYCRLKQRLDLSFLYELTAPLYGRCGQQSIDPVVFFKLCLVGYLENIISDRRLIEHYSLTYYREEYERVIARLKSRYGRKMKGFRQATVEPVLGTLINFMALRKINTRGIKQAMKGMLLAATAYNLQKLLRFTSKTSQSAVLALLQPLAAAGFRPFYWQEPRRVLEKIKTALAHPH